MADDNNNLPVIVDGNEQATIGTDVYSSGGETAHAQVMKVAWGDSSTVTRATENSPLPVKVFGLTGPLGTVTVTGAVRGLGTFNVGNTSGSAIHVTGGVNAFVYGVTGATPVAVTGSVSISSSVGITGVVNVTGGRYLNSATDSIMVSGTLAKSWNLTNANDNITVYGVGGATFLSSKIMGSDGTIIGNSGGALNVNLVGAGISATVNIGTVIGVENATGGVLRIEGTAGGTPVPVSISAITPSINVVNSESNPFFMDLMKSLILYNTNGQSSLFLNNLEKILLANDPVNPTKFIPIAEILRLVASISGAFGGPNSIYERLRSVQEGLSTIKSKSRIDYVYDPSVEILSVYGYQSVFKLSRSLSLVNQINLNSNGFLYQNKSERPIYLTSALFVSGLINNCGTAGECPDGVTVYYPGTPIWEVEIDVNLVSSPTLVKNIKTGSYKLPAGESVLLPTLYTLFYPELTNEGDNAFAPMSITIV